MKTKLLLAGIAAACLLSCKGGPVHGVVIDKSRTMGGTTVMLLEGNATILQTPTTYSVTLRSVPGDTIKHRTVSAEIWHSVGIGDTVTIN